MINPDAAAKCKADKRIKLVDYYETLNDCITADTVKDISEWYRNTKGRISEQIS